MSCLIPLKYFSLKIKILSNKPEMSKNMMSRPIILKCYFPCELLLFTQYWSI